MSEKIKKLEDGRIFVRDSRASLPEILDWMGVEVRKVIEAERVLLMAKVSKHGHDAGYRGEVISTSVEGLAEHRAPRKEVQRRKTRRRRHGVMERPQRWDHALSKSDRAGLDEDARQIGEAALLEDK